MRTIKQSQLQEKKVAEEIGGKRQIASGAKDGMKGDVKNRKWLGECKWTVLDHYVLTRLTWEKIEKEAIRSGLRIPFMQLDLLQGKKRLCVLTQADYTALFGKTVEDWAFIACKKQGKVQKSGVVLEFRGLDNRTEKSLCVILWEEVKEFLGESFIIGEKR